MLSSCTNCPNHSISKAERFNFFPLVLLNEAERAEGGVTWFPNSRPNDRVVVRALGRVFVAGSRDRKHRGLGRRWRDVHCDG